MYFVGNSKHIAHSRSYIGKVISAYLGLIVIFIAVVCYWHISPSADKSFATAQEQVQLLSKGSLQELIKDDTATPQQWYYLSAEKNNIPYYWNSIKSTQNPDVNRYIAKTDIGNNIAWVLNAEIITQRGILNPFLLEEAQREFSFTKVKKATNYKLNFNGKQHHFEVSERVISRTKLKYIFASILVFSILGLLMLLYLFRSKEAYSHMGMAMRAILLVGLRLVVYWSCHYTALSGLQILSSDNYFNIVTPSIGDLIFNSLFLAAICILLSRTKPVKLSSQSSTHMTAMLLLTSVYGLYLYVAFIAKSAVFTSGIQLNAEEILNFDVYSFSFVALLIFNLFLLFIYHYISIRWMCNNRLQRNNRNIIYLVGFVLLLTIATLANDFSFGMLLAIFMTALSLLIDIFWSVNKKTIVWIIWWIMIYSAFLAVLLFTFGLQKRIEAREVYLQQIYQKTDESVVFKIQEILNDSIVRKAVGSFTKSNVPNQFDRDDITDYLGQIKSIQNLQLPWSIKMFDSYGTNMIRYEYQNKLRFISSFDYLELIDDNIYFDHLSGKYIIVLQGNDADKQEQLFNVNLVIDNPNPQIDAIVTNYSIYQNGAYKTGKLDNERSNDIFASLDKGSHYYKNKSILVHTPTANKEIKIISNEAVANLIKPISLFSYLFCLTGVMMIFILILLRLVSHKKRFFYIEFDIVPFKSLRTRLQLSVIALVIFSFIVIGVVTVFFFSNEIQKNQRTEELKNVELLLKDINSRLSQAINNPSATAIFINNVFDLKSVHSCDLNLFDSYGELLVSTQDNFAGYKYPFKYYQQFAAVSSRATVITKDYKRSSLFLPLDPISQGNLGILEIKPLDKFESNFQISEFVSTILNVYVFLFLLAGAIAISIANSITRPLSQLSDNLKRTRLGKKNEPLEWQSTDEVGQLIQTYNEMINKLESSAEVLAKTERDLAWREMAKQVAHEIKNPLTPMKLSIQYLQRAIASDPANASKLIEKVSSTLVEQIDNLSQIAGEFSNFATMPQANNEKIVLNEIVEAVHDLFRKREDMDIRLIEPINDIYIYADRNHLVRILNNLLKNSIQAIPEDRRGKIVMALESKEGNAIISVQDNGKGIPDHMKEKVFTPNFTTKSSGTGLGLAISANMIESSNGKIYFDSVPGVGTTFYIEVPLMRLDDNRDRTNRVTLD